MRERDIVEWRHHAGWCRQYVRLLDRLTPALCAPDDLLLVALASGGGSRGFGLPLVADPCETRDAVLVAGIDDAGLHSRDRA